MTQSNGSRRSQIVPGMKPEMGHSFPILEVGYGLAEQGHAPEPVHSQVPPKQSRGQLVLLAADFHLSNSASRASAMRTQRAATLSASPWSTIDCG